MNKNRLHTASRWPHDPAARRALANTTVVFVDALCEVTDYDCWAEEELRQLYLAALQHYDLDVVVGGEGGAA